MFCESEVGVSDGWLFEGRHRGQVQGCPARRRPVSVHDVCQRAWHTSQVTPLLPFLPSLPRQPLQNQFLSPSCEDCEGISKCGMDYARNRLVDACAVRKRLDCLRRHQRLSRRTAGRWDARDVTPSSSSSSSSAPSTTSDSPRTDEFVESPKFAGEAIDMKRILQKDVSRKSFSKVL